MISFLCYFTLLGPVSILNSFLIRNDMESSINEQFWIVT